MNDAHRSAVVGFYDAHPINEDEILAKLKARGIDLDALTEAELMDFDQDHYGGVEAVEALAAAADISRKKRVLDVCSGMGGPARWLAYKYGCRVAGLDLTRSRVEGAKRLTECVKLGRLVEFFEGDATAMPFADSTFDVVISQEAWCHIPDKATLLSECARVLEPGGAIAFTDIVTVGELSTSDEERLAAEMQMPRPLRIAEYEILLGNNDLMVTAATDLSSQWRTILIDRLEMYRSLRDTTVAKLGEKRFAEYDSAYSHFVELFSAGKLGGYRVVGLRDA